ncbi:MAG: site-2 protease family protein [Clostridia bacterium]|nr:site-2 protease family protein [Clostridia bacterium]
MGGLSLTVHPLFFICGIYYSLTGKLFVFLICTVTALAHELGHSFVAGGCGYRLNKITLMPFGAVVKGDIEGLKFLDEMKIAIAGPVLNIFIGLFFIAFWWIFPEIYAYTDVIVSTSLSMALVNMLPAFPLDGGRVLSAYLSMKFGTKVAERTCKITGSALAFILLAIFLITAIKGTLNVSLLFFGLFVLFGALGRARENKYVKVYSAVNKEKLKHGIAIKRQAVDKSVTLKKLLSILDENAMNEIEVYDGEYKKAVFTDQKIKKLLEKGDLYSPIEKYI